MISSMTGFGRARGMTRLGEMQIELRGVNGRYLDLKVRTPRYLFILEPFLQKALRSHLGRGRIECSLNLNSTSSQQVDLKVNEGLAEAYLKAGEALKNKFQLGGDPGVEFLMRLPEVVTLKDPDVDSEELWQEIRPIFDEALTGFCEMRQREGSQLEKDFQNRLETLRGHVEQISSHLDEMVRVYRERITARMKELFADMKVDESRIAQEAAFLAERSDVTEELVRLRSHFDHFETLLKQKEPTGRKIDFLLQEILREINTIGSKTDVMEAIRLVLDLKNEVEKMREQAQNVE